MQILESNRDGLGDPVLVSHMDSLGLVPRSLFWPSPAVAIAGIWGVNLQMKCQCSSGGVGALDINGAIGTQEFQS